MVAELTPDEEEAILARSGIEIVLGGQPKKVAPLTIARNRVWKRILASRVGLSWASIADSADDWSQLVATIATMTEQHIDLLVAYDQAWDDADQPTQPGVLGGRDWIEGHASEREVWTGLKAVLDEAFPQIAELLRKVPPAVLIPTLLQLLRSSTSSPSPAGLSIEAPRSLKPRSRRASSRS
jgi:hypothetical protein